MADAGPLKPLHFSILLVLAEREDYGYGIVRRIAQTDAGGITIAPSNLYHVLDQLIDTGWIKASTRMDEDAPRRSYFRITPKGLRATRAETRRLEALLARAERLDALKESGSR